MATDPASAARQTALFYGAHAHALFEVMSTMHGNGGMAMWEQLTPDTDLRVVDEASVLGKEHELLALEISAEWLAREGARFLGLAADSAARARARDVDADGSGARGRVEAAALAVYRRELGEAA